jgi:hypothetical protein
MQGLNSLGYRAIKEQPTTLGADSFYAEPNKQMLNLLCYSEGAPQTSGRSHMPPWACAGERGRHDARAGVPIGSGWACWAALGWQRLRLAVGLRWAGLEVGMGWPAMGGWRGYGWPWRAFMGWRTWIV